MRSRGKKREISQKEEFDLQPQKTKKHKNRQSAEATEEEAEANIPEAEADTAEAKADPADAETPVEDGEGDETVERDPYLLAEADYINKYQTKWKNKQRTLVFCSRKVSTRHRHLMEDIRKMLPHHKPDSKWENTQIFSDINEVAEMKQCNNVIFFEGRKEKDLYMWISKVPHGPCAKFQVLNVHTMHEIRLTGNCLRHSRPFLNFDPKFDEEIHLRIYKELLIQALGTPRNHPKSKPFFDHIMSFMILDNKIWFRHYQIAPMTIQDIESPNRITLTEIGPRFVLDPIRILAGSFSGATLYQNPHFLSPTALRVQMKIHVGQGTSARYFETIHKREKEAKIILPEDPYSAQSVFGKTYPQPPPKKTEPSNPNFVALGQVTG